MMSVPRRNILAFILLASLPACSPVRAPRSAAVAPEPVADEAGVVVESAILHSAAAVAGLLPGDVILSWSSAASKGLVSSPFDLLFLELEESPRRAVTLHGRRGGEERAWTVTTGDWGLETQPAGSGRPTAWSLDRRARELSGSQKWPEADATYPEALAALEREGEPAAAAQLLRTWGASFHFRSDWDAAIERYQKALAMDRPKSLAAAHSLVGLGYSTAKKGDFDAAEELFQQALAIQEELAPGTTEIAVTLNKLGVLARWRGDLDTAEKYLARAEELRRGMAPNSIGHAQILINLGNVAVGRGDMTRAESMNRKALAIFEIIEPDGGAVVGCIQTS